MIPRPSAMPKPPRRLARAERTGAPKELVAAKEQAGRVRRRPAKTSTTGKVKEKAKARAKAKVKAKEKEKEKERAKAKARGKAKARKVRVKVETKKVGYGTWIFSVST